MESFRNSLNILKTALLRLSSAGPT